MGRPDSAVDDDENDNQDVLLRHKQKRHVLRLPIAFAIYFHSSRLYGKLKSTHTHTPSLGPAVSFEMTIGDDHTKLFSSCAASKPCIGRFLFFKRKFTEIDESDLNNCNANWLNLRCGSLCVVPRKWCILKIPPFPGAQNSRFFRLVNIPSLTLKLRTTHRLISSTIRYLNQIQLTMASRTSLVSPTPTASNITHRRHFPTPIA